MDVFIYFRSRLPVTRDVIEDALEDYLEDQGEVTGSGSGESGSNIDIEIFEGDARRHLAGLRKVLKKLKLPADGTIVIEDERFPVYE